MLTGGYTRFERPNERGWVSDISQIRRHYFYGWFAVDFLSVFPFWIFSFFTKDNSTKTLTKLFRLAKLTRFFRIGSILKRWEARSNIKYAKMALIKWFGLIVLICHWLACMWMITVHISPNPRVSDFVFVSVLLVLFTIINPCVLFWWDIFVSYPIPPPCVVLWTIAPLTRPDNVLNLPSSYIFSPPVSFCRKPGIMKVGITVQESRGSVCTRFASIGRYKLFPRSATVMLRIHKILWSDSPPLLR